MSYFFVELYPHGEGSRFIHLSSGVNGYPVSSPGLHEVAKVDVNLRRR